MAIQKIPVQCVEIEDRPGSLQQFLARLSSAGVDLLCFAAFSTGTDRGRVYLSGKNAAVLESGLKRAGAEFTAAAGFIISGEDKAGAAANALKGLADAQINGQAGAAIVCDGRYQMLIVVDAADADAAGKALQGI